MQTEELSEVETGAAAPDLVTAGAAAARKCPECESLMTTMVIEGDFAGQQTSCPECGYSEPLALTEESDPEPRQMSCETCGVQVLISPLKSGHGFKLIAIEREVDGIDHTSTFGVSANGFPVCPKDGVALIPVGAVPVGEAFGLVAEALPQPVQPRLPGTTPPFNEHEALLSIERMNLEVEEAKREYDVRREKAAAAKKHLDETSHQLTLLISELGRRRQEYEYEAMGRLATPQDSPCLYERRAGKPCPTCRVEMKKAKTEDGDDVDLRLISLQAHLEHREFFLTYLELADLATRDNGVRIDALEVWAHDETVKPADLPQVAELVKRSCLAGPFGEEGRRCELCAKSLSTEKDTAYPEGACVGLECAGAPDLKADEPDAARTIPKRHKKPGDAAAAKSKAAREAKTEKPAKAARQKRARA